MKMDATYANNFLDEGLLDRHFGALDGAHGRADPRDERELGSLAQLVARVNSEKRE